MKRILLVSVLAWVGCHAEPTSVHPSVVVTTAATELTGTTAVVSGTVNPHGVATEAWFEWSEDASLVEAAVTSAQPMGGGSTDATLTASLAGLVPDHTYYYRAVGSSAGGIVRGNILSFTTPRPPSAYTFQYELTANYSNVVNGFLWPYGNSTLAWFEYGTDSTFTTFAQTAKRSVGSGTERVTVAETLPGLQKYTRYYLRIVGSSVGGTATGNVAWFSTGGPPEIVSSGFFPSASCDAANLFAFATPNGAETEGWFEVGATSSMSDYTATPAQSLGAATARPVSFRATLPMGATFYFRAVVRNWLGTERDVVNVVGPDLCVK